MVESYRSVMEVLKWVEPKQTLSNAVALNKCFERVCASDELWCSYLESEKVNFQVTVQPGNLKQSYKLLYRLTRNRLLFHSDTADSFSIVNCGREAINKVCPDQGHLIEIGSALTFVSCTELLVCGGQPFANRYARVAVDQAYIFNMYTLEVTRIPDMCCRRAFHAILFRKSHVYAFGGNVSSKSAEKYALSAQQWTLLPSMIAKHSCLTVCSQGKLIYLCGGNAKKCETFNCDTEQFHLLSLKVPKCWTVSFLYQGNVICLSEQVLYHVNRTTKGNRAMKELPCML